MSQRSHVSRVALYVSKVKVPWVTQWLSEWQGHILSCSGQLKIKCVWGWCEELLAVMREQEGGWPQPSNLHWRPNQWDCSKQKIKDKPMRLYDIWNKIKFFNSIDMACSLFNAIQPSNWHWRPNRWDCRKQKLRFLIVSAWHVQSIQLAPRTKPMRLYPKKLRTNLWDCIKQAR